jgi:hypothetical protein
MAIMRDYLKISGDYVEKIYLFALKSLNEDGLVAKNSLDNEIRLARNSSKSKTKCPNPRSQSGNLLRTFSPNDNIDHLLLVAAGCVRAFCSLPSQALR